MGVCSACGAENPEGARFCNGCGAPLEAPASERRKLATLLFCDMSGSTAMGERVDAESVRSLMLSYFHEMREALERHGGTVEKFVGDAVLAVFGVPTAHEDDALRACRAALEMQARLATLNEQFERRFGTRIALRIGLDTGEVVAGDASSRETFVTGDPVNVAARLEQAARPGEVLIGEPTLALVRSAVRAEAIEPLSARGKSEPVPAYRLLAVEDFAPAPRGGRAPFTGREAQLESLEQAFRRVVAGECRLFTLVGEPGVGKSRLVEEFLSRVAMRARVVRGSCLSYGDGITYWAVAQIVRDLAGILDRRSRSSSRRGPPPTVGAAWPISCARSEQSGASPRRGDGESAQDGRSFAGLGSAPSVKGGRQARSGSGVKPPPDRGVVTSAVPGARPGAPGPARRPVPPRR